MDPKEIENRLRENIKVTHLKLTDATGSGDHWRLEIESPEFIDKTLVEQHQIVYKALGDWLQEKIHALSIHTSAPKS